MSNRNWAGVILAPRRYFADFHSSVVAPCDTVTLTDTGEIRQPLGVSFERIGLGNPRWRYEIEHFMSAGRSLDVNILERELVAPLNSVKTTKQGAPHNCVDKSTHTGYWPGVNLPENLPLPYDSSLYSEVDANALRIFWKRLRSADHQFQGGVFAGEIAQTVRMLVRPLSTLRKGISSYLRAVDNRTKKVRDPKKLRRVVGDTWLEYSFGWVPLVSDLKDAVRAATRIITNPPVKRVKSNAGDESSVTTLSTITYDRTVFSCRSITKRTYSVQYIGGLRATGGGTGASASAERILSLAGLDPRSFLPTVWELVPWSFMIDYFSNVGDLIEQISTDTSQLIFVSRTKKFTSELTVRGSNDVASTKALDGSGFVSLVGPEGVGVSRQKRFIRETPITLPFQGLQLGIDLKWKQVANISALIASGKLLSRKLGSRS